MIVEMFRPHSHSSTVDARVVDDGRTYEGISGVESFLRNAASEYTYTRTLVAAEEVGPDRWRSPTTSKATSRAARSICPTSSNS